ncbi:natural killer cells antigen CD94 [Xenopus laevis]|uniref:C-type lectin domain-containing protein n=2 Tax=Xenopus laevis TaxID=8355 RepID=A0A974CWX4_XENLA|nr:natural killer cells antigen CD94 [Xenopus laevis]OCT81479.1 hypothetical protein XELAEV_18028299mg [Xenopus laevis]
MKMPMTVSQRPEDEPFLSGNCRLDVNQFPTSDAAADPQLKGDQQNSSSTGPGHWEAATSQKQESIWLRLQQRICWWCSIAVVFAALGFGIGIFIGRSTVHQQIPVTCSPSCPDKWTLYNSTCYFASLETQDYNSSKYFCAEQGATLLLNNETVKAMKDLGMATNDRWIGLRRNQEGKWQWENGPLYKGEGLDNNENLNCAYFSGKIRTLECSSSRAFICMKHIKNDML